MKALVTGATGFIGSHLVEKLLENGFSVKCYVRKSANMRWIKDLTVEIVYGDLFDLDLLKVIRKMLIISTMLPELLLPRKRRDIF
jgi:nucleoside-diphosphate-sugar epimerase